MTGDARPTDDRPSVLITGCSSGIGLATAQALAGRGWRVVASCRKRADCERLSEAGFARVRLDYEAPETIPEAYRTALAHTGGRLDALVNNGAYAIPGCVEDLPVEALRAIFEANLFGWHELTRLALPTMHAQGGGRIVNVSSVLGLTALKYRGAYVATKFALEGLSDTLRLELRGTPIRVVTVEPGPIATRFRINARPQFHKWVDWRSSPNRDFYEAHLIPRLDDEGGTQPFELGADAVAAKVARVLASAHPPPRVFVTTPTYLLALARRLLPTRWLDAVAEKASR